MEILENDSTKLTIRPDNIIEIHIKPSWDQPDTVETVTAAAMLVQKAVDRKKRAVLFFLPNIYIKKEIMNAHRSVEVHYVALAMLVNSFGNKLLSNIIIQFAKPDVPTKTFTKQSEAEAWLKQFL